MVVFIDPEFKCHVAASESTYASVETDFFDGKCDAFIEGYRYVPAGETWVREDNVEFKGEMIAPWRDYNILEEIQKQHEKTLNAAYEAYENGVNSI